MDYAFTIASNDEYLYKFFIPVYQVFTESLYLLPCLINILRIEKSYLRRIYKLLISFVCTLLIDCANMRDECI